MRRPTSAAQRSGSGGGCADVRLRQVAEVRKAFGEVGKVLELPRPRERVV